MTMSPWTNPSPPRPDQIDLAQPVNFSHPQARGLVAYYPLWLGKSPIHSGLDRSFGRYPLVPTNGPTVGADGTFGRAVRFTSASVQSMQLGAAVVSSMPFSAFGWFRMNTVNSQQSLISLVRSDAFHCWMMYYQNTSSILRLNCTAGQGTDDTLSGSLPVPSTGWFHGGMICRSATNRQLYVNGIGDNIGTVSRSPSGVNRTSLGVWGGNWAPIGVHVPFNGFAGEYRFYNRALTDAEVYNLWHPGRRWGMLRTLTGRRVFTVQAAAATFKPYWIPRTNKRIGAFA